MITATAFYALVVLLTLFVGMFVGGIIMLALSKEGTKDDILEECAIMVERKLRENGTNS